MKDIDPDAPKKHPIQLMYLGVRELFIRSNVPPDPMLGMDEKSCSYTIACPSVYNPSEEIFTVSVKMEVGTGDKEASDPFSMKIELVGYFSVDTSQFPAEHVIDWAQKGAMFVFSPFLREHAYALSSRSGFKPMILPLLEVPTIRVEKPKRRKKTE